MLRMLGGGSRLSELARGGGQGRERRRHPGGDRLMLTEGVPLSILALHHFCSQNASYSGPEARAPCSANDALCSTSQRAPSTRIFPLVSSEAGHSPG